MSSILLITSITFFILSIVISFVMAIMYKRIGIGFTKKLIWCHFLLWTVFIFLFLKNQTLSTSNNLESFIAMFAFCSGLSFAGLMIRSQIHLVLKFYFSIYFLSIVAFLFSPSKLFSFITTGKMYSNAANTFQLQNNFYLESQQSMIADGNNKQQYKIYQKLGIFNKTIARNIDLQHKPDSVKTLYFDAEKIAFIRVYFIDKTKADSIDKTIDLTVPLKENTITKGKPN